jgi:hypothetical protein
MSSAAVFGYLLGRRALDRRAALFVAVLTVVVPSMVYSTRMMVESLAYPAFLACVLAIIRMLERPSTLRQLIALLAIALAALTRVDMVALLPALGISVVLAAALIDTAPRGEETGATFWQRLSRYRLTLLLLGIGAGAALAVAALKPDVLGGHKKWLDAFDPAAVPRWVLIYFGDLDLYVGVVPFAAFLLMVGLAVRSGIPAEARRILLLSASIFVSFVLFIACYSTGPRLTTVIQDRHLFYLAPLELIAFMLWLSLGLPRPRRLTLVAAGAALVAPAFIPFSEVLTGREWGVSASTVALVPWGLLKGALGAHAVLTAVILALCGVAVLAFLFVPARAISILRTIVVANFMFVTLFVLAANGVVSQKAGEQWVAPDSGWVTAAVGPESSVVGVWATDDGRVAEGTENRVRALLENALIRSDTRLYAYGDAHGLLWNWPPFMRQAAPNDEGAIVESGMPIRADYALVGPELRVRGTEVARDPHSGLVLYRLEGSELRLR